MKPVTIAALALLATPTFAQESIVRNRSYEDGAGKPAEWAFNSRRTTSEIAYDRSRGRSGTASVRITNRSRAETGNVVQGYRLDPPLAPGTRLSFSAFVATENCQGSPQIIMQLYSTANIRQNASAHAPGGTHDFEEAKGEMVVQNPSNRLSMYLCNYHIGTAWWDDATLTVERAEPSRVIARPRSNGRVFAMETKDGLRVGLSDTGGVTSLSIDDREVSAKTRHAGLWVRPFAGDAIPVCGEIMGEEDGRVVQRSEQAGLRVDATFTSASDHVQCRGAVVDTMGKDRAVDVLFALPVGGKGWRWGQSIREERPLADQPVGTNVTTFSSVSETSSGLGVALAVPADSPCDCSFTHDAEFGYAVRYRFGLAPDAGGDFRSRAPFSFVIYRCDGAWGLRDAARRYYELYPWAFAKRVKREGLWLFGAAPKWLPDPGNYTFHEGGLRQWAYGDQHDFYTCPYIIPGQREITRLPKLPASKAEAMQIFKRFDAKGTKRGRGWGAQKKNIIENCMLLDHRGEPQIRIRNSTWGGNSVTFPLNANPKLPADKDRHTIANVLLDSVAQWFETAPTIDGTYVDSLGAWGDYLNLRREHFRYAQTPLTYDPVSGKPAISNQYGLLEFLWALRDLLHSKDKVLFANGVHHTRRFHFFALDIMGVEGKSGLEQKRVMAYQKPFLLLIYNIHEDPVQMEHYFHRCTFYGIYPSFGHLKVFDPPSKYEPVKELNDRFVPVLRKITTAGWHPITHARSSRPDVWIERWGPSQGQATYLTTYNSSESSADVTITVDTAALSIRGKTVRAADELSGQTWKAAIRKGQASLSLTAPAQQVLVLELGAG